MIGESDQVSAGVNRHNEFVPLRAVSDGQLDHAQREVNWTRAILQLLDSLLQLLCSIGVGNIRSDAGRRLLAVQELLGARNSQV